jgi:hypothetical protein
MMTEDNADDDGRFWQVLAVNVAAGSSVKAASEAAGCSERTAYRISAEPKFRQRVAELRNEMTSQAVGVLSAAASEAVTTIRELLTKTNEPSVRLNASKAILNALGPLSELAEIRERLSALESKS